MYRGGAILSESFFVDILYFLNFFRSSTQEEGIGDCSLRPRCLSLHGSQGNRKRTTVKHGTLGKSWEVMV